MNFSRYFSGVRETGTAVSGGANPLSNRFIAAMLATLAALIISTVGSGQWASADSGTTVPDPDPPPTSTLGAPRHVIAKAGDASAAVTWVKPAESDEEVEIDGYIVTASPSGITVETDDDDDMLVIV